MEFINLNNYIPVRNPQIAPFSQLRKMEPLLIDQELRIVEQVKNLEYAHQLAKSGHKVVRVRKMTIRNPHEDRIEFPRRIIAEMTSKCNFFCRMCPQQNLSRPRIHMEVDAYKALFDEIETYGVEGCWLYHLGESLLHPQFNEIIEHISTKKNLGKIWLSTNGQYFTEDKIRIILASTIGYINFSLHAVTPEVYKEVAPQGDYEVVRSNLETFLELKGADIPKKPYLHLQMIEQEPTAGEVDAFIRMYHERSEIVSINMLEYVNLPNNKDYGMLQRERKPLRSCTRVSRGDCFIFSNGDVTLCDVAYNAEICLGNIFEKSLYEIWNSPERKKILELNQEGRMYEIEFCRSCTDYDI
ncbi:radical SAM/SPASM domain-containing protein [Desulfonema magnum]|uniref:Radical SAM and SPASM domains-containing protein n=1 Tax=Desulfonema magnum TaxID=45655 RepID=A0A975BMI3_9BACT|nr:radical SAM/SPASM domain-containing protein [Desulfonema magnum]QTA87903.1 Radical SAM and SPASM domains-containing protein [Desulfonema magnum]